MVRNVDAVARTGGRRRKKLGDGDGCGRAGGMGTETLLKIKEHEKRILNWQWWHVCVDALEVGLAAIVAGGWSSSIVHGIATVTGQDE